MSTYKEAKIMDKKTREKKIQEFIDWRKDKAEEEIGLSKYIDPKNLPDKFFDESESSHFKNNKIVHYGSWKPSPELLEEYKDELEIYHKWARQSRGEE